MDFSKLDKLNEDIREMKKIFQQEAQATIVDIFKEFFENNPEATAISWEQYTPFFNDGEECVFRSTAEYCSVTNAKEYESIRYGEYSGEEDEDTIWIDDWNYGDLNPHLIPPRVHSDIREIRKFLSKIPDETYKDMFGDHVKVYVTRSGAEVEEYSDHE